MAARAAPLLLVLLAVATLSPAVAERRGAAKSVAAVQKVIQMLQDILATCKQEKMDEEVAFAKFFKWCEMEQASLKKDIEDGEAKAEELSAAIAKLLSDAKILGEEIAQLQSDLADYEADLKGAKAQREKDHKDYLAEVADYSESVDALERAIMVLERQNYDRTGKEVLLQLSDKAFLPQVARQMLSALLGLKATEPATALGGMDYEAPEANAYEFQSGGIITVLKNLLAEFRQKKGQCEKEEMNSLHAFNMVVTDLTDSIENAKEDIDTKTALKAEKEKEAAADKEELTSTLQVLEVDKTTLSDLEAECAEKKLSFDEKQRLRADEISAIMQAIKIMSSETVSGHADTYLDLAQAPSLVQVGRRADAVAKDVGASYRVHEFLAAEGARLHSSKIALLAQKLAADPFAKVKKLIDDMITRLLEEANQDAAHEGWCDTELGKSKVTRNKLQEDIAGLEAAIEEGKATIQGLAEEIATLTEEVAELQAAMAKATAIREEEKEKNAITIKDAKETQEAVSAAIAILKDFYKRASAATALLQMDEEEEDEDERPVMGSEEWKSLANPNYEAKTVTIDGTVKVDKGHKEGMQTFGKTYKGKQDEAGGVLALMDVILSDFVTLETDTATAEATSQRAYDSFMIDSKRAVATKTKKIEMDTADKAAAEKKLELDTKDLKATQDELLAADRYHAKLVPQCIDQGVTWEQRQAQREAEIKSLKEALAILSSEDIQTSAF